MARISTVFRGGRYRVSIRGPLSFQDLGRLERACGPALEHERMPLEIRIVDLAAMDEAARLYLGHLAMRGAIIVGR
jgi:hypothetical protein